MDIQTSRLNKIVERVQKELDAGNYAEVTDEDIANAVRSEPSETDEDTETGAQYIASQCGAIYEPTGDSRDSRALVHTYMFKKDHRAE